MERTGDFGFINGDGADRGSEDGNHTGGLEDRQAQVVIKAGKDSGGEKGKVNFLGAVFYKCRWQVELFFKWIKQHLRIKAFHGTSENAVKTHIWIAVSVYVLVAIIRKRLGLEASLYQTLQILSVTLFEKTPILCALQAIDGEANFFKKVFIKDLPGRSERCTIIPLFDRVSRG